MPNTVILTSQPGATLSVVPNQNTTLTVVASSNFDATYAYQWKKDNSHISGATSSVYSFEPALADNSKVFVCMVNALSASTVVASVSSSGLTLTVSTDSSVNARHVSGPVASSNPSNESGTERFLRMRNLGYF
jgi:hypothetical protein